MKYVNDATNTLKDTPVSTSLGVAGAALATMAAMRHVKLDNPAVQALALAGAAVAGFAATYAGSRLTEKGVSCARNCTFFGGSGKDTSASDPAPSSPRP